MKAEENLHVDIDFWKVMYARLKKEKNCKSIAWIDTFEIIVFGSIKVVACTERWIKCKHF